jgi:sugar O-acyltransferase (sialic acid O-acetyltransferase NeuD family)
MSDRPVFIIGSGGHAEVIASFLAGRTIRFLVEGAAGPNRIRQADFFADAAIPDGDYFIGIGDNAIRRRYFDRIAALGGALPACIAPNAWVAADARLGRGAFIGAGAVVMTGVTIGDSAIVNTLSSIDHHSVLGADSQVTVGVSLGSELRIGRGCFFGMKCCVVPRIEIGDRAQVMAGAVVVRSVAAGALVGGVPARVMRAGEPDPASAPA